MTEWNWLGIFLWLFLVAYILFVVYNVHSRKRKVLKLSIQPKRHYLVPKMSMNNFTITAIEVIVMVLLAIGLVKERRSHVITPHNSIVTTQVQPLQMTHTKQTKRNPTAKLHYYVVEVKRTKSRSYQQKYVFMSNGQNEHADNKRAILTYNAHNLRHNENLPYVVQKKFNQKITQKRLNSNKPWVMKFVTKYKDTAMNGIGLHAGSQKYFYTIICVPNKTDIYNNNSKIKTHKTSLK